MSIDEQERARLELSEIARLGEGWAGEPHECTCSGPDESCPACSSLPQYLADVAATLGRRGGRARARRLSPERRSAIARQAARSRWHPTD